MGRICKLMLVITALLCASVVSAGAAVADSSNTVTVHVHSTSKTITPNTVVDCVATVPNPYQIVAGAARPWYTESYVSSCSVPPPDSCSIVVSLDELVNDESGNQSWQNRQEGNQTSVAPCKINLKSMTSGYKCLSTLTDHEFKASVIFSIFWNGQVAVGVKDSNTVTIPCE